MDGDAIGMTTFALVGAVTPGPVNLAALPQLPGPQESIGQLHQQLHTADDQLHRQWRNHERKFQTHVSFLGVADN
jgi:hypothetical protein